MRYLSIKNFAKYQHYKDRRPPWIKLHVEVLDDYHFVCLHDASKAHLMLLWVLASKMDNRIPYDLPFLSRKLGTTSPIDVDELVLQGFIEVSQDDSAPLASRKQSAMPETEREAEREAETEAEAKTDTSPRKAAVSEEFAKAWGLYPKRSGSNARADAYKAWRARVKGGVSPADLVAGVERYAAYVRGRGIEGTEFVMQAVRFFGPSEQWAETWFVPGAAPATRPRLMASPTEEADRRHQAEVARAERYAAARRRAIAVWVDAHPDEHAQFVAQVERRYAGKQGEWIAPARDAEIEHLCGHAADFPPFEKWQPAQPSHAGAA